MPNPDGRKQTSDRVGNRKPMQFTGRSGPAGDFSGLSAVQVFQLFFCSTVWDLLVDETNRYAEQTVSETYWTPTHSNEMMAFVALLLAMGINKSPQYSMYWSTSPVPTDVILSIHNVKK